MCNVWREMWANLEADGVTLCDAAIETDGTSGTIEMYYSPLRPEFLQIRTELNRDASHENCLKLAVLSISAKSFPEDLFAMLLVFCVMPWPARQAHSLAQLWCSRALESAIMDGEREPTGLHIAFSTGVPLR